MVQEVTPSQGRVASSLVKETKLASGWEEKGLK